RISLSVCVVRSGPSVMEASEWSRASTGQWAGLAGEAEYISFPDDNDRRDSVSFGQSRSRRRGSTQGPRAGSKKAGGVRRGRADWAASIAPTSRVGSVVLRQGFARPERLANGLER